MRSEEFFPPSNCKQYTSIRHSVDSVGSRSADVIAAHMPSLIYCSNIMFSFSVSVIILLILYTHTHTRTRVDINIDMSKYNIHRVIRAHHSDSYARVHYTYLFFAICLYVSTPIDYLSMLFCFGCSGARCLPTCSLRIFSASPILHPSALIAHHLRGRLSWHDFIVFRQSR